MQIDTDAERLRWDLACTAIRLLKIDPVGLKGMLVAASHGPVHQAFQTCLAQTFPLVRVPVSITEERLLGGLDINETLNRGHRVRQAGLLDSATGALLINGAERLETTIAGMLCAHLDKPTHADTNTVLVAFDESLPDDAGLATSALADRIALMLPLPNLPLQQLQQAIDEVAAMDDSLSTVFCENTSQDISSIELPESLLKQLVELAARLGVHSLRPLLFASRVARANAALNGRTVVEIADAAIATQLVLAPRATLVPEPADAERAEPENTEAETQPDSEDNKEQPPLDAHQEPEDQPPENATPPDSDPESAPEDDNTEDDKTPDEPVEMGEQLLAAANATLPAHLIAALARGQKSGISAGRDADASSVGQFGRPAGVRRPRGHYRRQRLNIIETLKAAAPMQRLRGNENNSHKRLQIRVDDFRVTRFKQPSRTTTLFVVDASGSASLHRLAEAKGAVELLLAECYVRRDRVALISFRGQCASLELPPTRSLVRAKRQLAGLPGGGGTPLAAGLDLAAELVRQLRQAGETPVVVLMTDGKANISRNGEASRVAAMQDAEQAARKLALLDVHTLFIDMSPRARAQAAELASMMNARYLPLPPGGSGMLPSLMASS